MSHSQEHSKYHTDTKESCPECHVPLACISCWIGGGSHYWRLRCPSCEKEFQFDTYRFKLEPLTLT